MIRSNSPAASVLSDAAFVPQWVIGMSNGECDVMTRKASNERLLASGLEGQQ